MRSRAIKFLNAYDKNDVDSFFGRTTEIDELFEKIKKSPLTLLYGLCGTGKTSLVQCGLAKKFNDDAWLPIFIRRGEDIMKSLRNAIDQNADTLTHPDKSIIEALNNLYLDHFVQITLLFDQFEELFISRNEEEIEKFSSFIADLLQSKINCKVIIIVREEYLAYFDGFEQKIPIIFDNRMRLERMRRKTIEDVIINIANDSNILIKSDIAQRMADNITDNKGIIELMYLQVYLDKLYRNSCKEFNSETIDKIGKLADILGDFLEEQTELIINKLGNKELIWKILKHLITDEGTKKPVTKNDFKVILDESQWNLLPSYLHALEESRIIKQEFGLYELTHDSLAAKIVEHLTSQEKTLVEVKQIVSNAIKAYQRTGALMESEQLIFIKKFGARLQLSKEEKDLITLSHNRQKQRKLILWLLIVGFFGLLGIYSIGVTKINNKLEESNRKLNRAICNELLAKAERLFSNNEFDSAITFYNSAKNYYRPDSINKVIVQVKSKQTDFLRNNNIWQPKIDSLKNCSEYKEAVIICDSVLSKFPQDPFTLKKRKEIIEIGTKEILSQVDALKGISELQDKACELLIEAFNLSPNDTNVIRQMREFNCK